MKKQTKRVAALLLLLVLLFGVLPIPVHAADSAELKIPFKLWGDSSNTFRVSFKYPGDSSGTTYTTSMTGMNIHYINGKVAYCLEPQASSTANTVYSQIAPGSSLNVWEQYLSKPQRKAIALALTYGAPNTLNSSTTLTKRGYEIATQVVIWEIIVGYRSTTKPYSRTNSAMYDFFLPLMNANDSTGVLRAGFVNGYSSIATAMSKHGNIPSFADDRQAYAPTHSMTYNTSSGKYEITLTDTNHAIDNDFPYTNGNGLTFSKSGNKLSVTATAAALASPPVMVKSTGSDPDVEDVSPVIWGTARSNHKIDQIVCQLDTPDPVNVYFKLQPGTTSLEIIKQSSDGNVANITFTVKDSSGNTLFTGKTNSSGKLTVPNLNIGDTVTVTETVPDNYVAANRTQTITLTAGTNTLTFTNYPMGSMTMQKVSETGDVEGYCFKLYQWSANKSWWGKSDANGRVYAVSTDNYTEPANESDRVYTFTGLTDGTYTFMEKLSKHGAENVTVKSIHIQITNKGSVKYDHTFTESEIVYADNGDCSIQKISLTGLSDGGVMSITVENKPIESTLDIIKTSTDGNVANISFKVEQYEPEGGIGWWTRGTYQTDSEGKISISGLTVGTKLRITEIVPEDYICTSENPKTVTLVKGTNQVTFENKPIVKLEIIKTSTDGSVANISFKVEQYEPEGGIGWWTRGTYQTDAAGKILLENLTVGAKLRITEIVPENYICTTDNPQTITLVKGTNQVCFTNEPIAKLEILKTSPDGNVANISFTVEEFEPQINTYWTRGTYQTDSEGRIFLDGLTVGAKLRITELVPEGYENTSENPVFLTLQKGLNTVSFSNIPVAPVEIIKTSPDGNVADILFTVETLDPETGTYYFSGTYQTDADGKIQIGPRPVGEKLRITEHVPENYICTSENPKTITVKTSTNAVSFENKPIVQLELLKVSEDGNVEGIEFTLERKGKGKNDYEFIGRFVTDRDGRIIVEDLIAGAVYRLTETVPEGYVGEKPVQTFTAHLGSNTVAFENRLIRGNLVLVKVDKGTQTPLAGAGFRFFDASGAEIAEDYTDENGEIHLENLAYGEYTYQEFEAPEGFDLDDTIYPFSITEDGETIRIVRENEPTPGSIRVRKVNEEGRAMPGVVFLLEYSTDNGSTWNPVRYREYDEPIVAGTCTNDELSNGRLTTDANGWAEYTGLCIDTQLGSIRYRLTEVKTWDGYNLLTEPAFDGTLSLGDETDVEITAVNTPTFKMPATGGNGFGSTIIAFALLGCFAAIFLYALTKKRRGKE